MVLFEINRQRSSQHIGLKRNMTDADRSKTDAVEVPLGSFAPDSVDVLLSRHFPILSRTLLARSVAAMCMRRLADDAIAFVPLNGQSSPVHC